MCVDLSVNSQMSKDLKTLKIRLQVLTRKINKERQNLREPANYTRRWRTALELYCLEKEKVNVNNY